MDGDAEEAILRRLVEAGTPIVRRGCGDKEGDVGGAAPRFSKRGILCPAVIGRFLAVRPIG